MLCLERIETQVWRASVHTESEAWQSIPVIAEPERRIPKLCWPASLAELASFGFRDPVSKNSECAYVYMETRTHACAHTHTIFSVTIMGQRLGWGSSC